MQAVQNEVDETQRDLALEALLRIGSVIQLGVAALHEQQDFFDDFRTRARRCERIRHHFAEQQSFDKGKKSGEGKFDEAIDGNAFITRKPLPGKLLPVKLFCLPEQVLERFVRDVRVRGRYEARTQQTLKALAARREESSGAVQAWGFGRLSHATRRKKDFFLIVRRTPAGGNAETGLDFRTSGEPHCSQYRAVCARARAYGPRVHARDLRMGALERTMRLTERIIRVALAASCAAPGMWPSLRAHAQDSVRTRVVMLGTGTPNADPERSGPAVAIIVNGTAYLVDAGPGIVRRAAAAKAAGVSGLEMPKLSRVFLTHLHSDHTVGLPDLMLSPWVLERTQPLHIYGPPGTGSMVRHLRAAYAEDIRMRRHGLEPSNKSGYRSIAHEIAPGIVYQDSNVTVRAFGVQHGSWRHAFAYRFETRDRVIVVSGDTRASSQIVQACNGCDVLVHEVYSDAGFKRRPVEWQRYHSAFHTSASELGRIALDARPNLLVLYHQLYWGSTDEDIVREVQTTYAGKVVSAHDLGVY